MKLLIAADSAISAEVLVGAVGVRPWPDGTTARVLSVVADADVPEEVWREEGYGKGAVRREMERRGAEKKTARGGRFWEVRRGHVCKPVSPISPITPSALIKKKKCQDVSF